MANDTPNSPAEIIQDLDARDKPIGQPIPTLCPHCGREFPGRAEMRQHENDCPRRQPAA